MDFLILVISEGRLIDLLLPVFNLICKRLGKLGCCNEFLFSMMNSFQFMIMSVITVGFISNIIIIIVLFRLDNRPALSPKCPVGLPFLQALHVAEVPLQ